MTTGCFIRPRGQVTADGGGAVVQGALSLGGAWQEMMYSSWERRLSDTDAVSQEGGLEEGIPATWTKLSSK